MSMPAGTLNAIRRIHRTRLLPHTCTIVPVTAATYDTPASEGTAKYTGLPCDYREDTEAETTDQGGTQLVTRSRLKLPTHHEGEAVEVEAGDRVTLVTNQAGETFGPFAIDGDPVHRMTHLVVMLRKVS